MSARQLVNGSPVPEDESHTELKANGQQRDYVVLTPEERAKGFVKPVRESYVHLPCGHSTRMGRSIAETYAREPKFYSGTFCVGCGNHYPLIQFEWEDGEPMHVPLQAAWAEERAKRQAIAKAARIASLKAELARLEES